MVNFFRKMRSSLFQENKIRKYFIYALGEILLIVLGILIALQINNMNEKKKNNLLSNEMVSEIKRGIGSDLNELNKFISNHNSVFKSQLIISDWLKSEEKFLDSLVLHLSKTYVATDYSINYSGYETLKKFGLKRIENDSLRTLISNLYEIKYPTFTKFSEIYQGFLDELLAVNSKHFNELNYMKPTMRPKEPKELKKDTEYAYHFNTLKNFNQLLIFQGVRLREEMKSVYSSIK